MTTENPAPPDPIANCRVCGKSFHLGIATVARRFFEAKPEDGNQLCVECLRDNVLGRELHQIARRLGIEAFVFGGIWVSPLWQKGSRSAFEADARRTCSCKKNLDPAVVAQMELVMVELLSGRPFFGKPEWERKEEEVPGGAP